MTATEIVDSLLEGSHPLRAKQRKEIEAAGLGDAEDFYLASIARVEAGKLIDSPGVLAAYTHNWPEFDSWIAYNHGHSYGNPTAHERDEHYRFYNTPEEWHQYSEGIVRYEGKTARLPNVKGYFQWKVEWNRSESSYWKPTVTVDIEWWDREASRIWKSHWKQPVMYDFKKDVNAFTQSKEHWDAAHPDYFDTAPFDTKLKAKLVKDAQAFLAKLAKVAKIDKVRWNVPELFQEARQKDGPSSKGFVQVGGDFGDPWSYGGDWFNESTGDIVHFDGVDDRASIESGDMKVDSVMQVGNYLDILKTVSLENTNDWENKEDEIRQAIANELESSRKYQVHRTCVEKDETIEHDWDSTIERVKVQFDNPDETWSSMSPVQKMLEIANYLGWHEFDSYPSAYTKAELSAYLGIDL